MLNEIEDKNMKQEKWRSNAALFLFLQVSHHIRNVPPSFSRKAGMNRAVARFKGGWRKVLNVLVIKRSNCMLLPLFMEIHV